MERWKTKDAEFKLKELLNELWEFVGDGEVVLGNISPDFPNAKIMWLNKEKGRKEIFSRYGYDTLVIWEHELKDEAKLVEKLKVFKEV